MSRMHDALAEGRPAIGCILLTRGAEQVETLGAAGLDVVCIDMMISGIDWGEAADMIRAAHQLNVTPWVRLPGYPWGDEGASVDTSTTAAVLRALSIGAEGVTVSVETPAQVRAILHPADDPHRRVWMTGNTWLVENDAAELPHPLVFPFVESLSALERIEEILDVPGLEAMFLGMGDISRQLGHPGDNRHPAVEQVIQDVVSRARMRGVMVMANTGYIDEAEQVRDAVLRLWQFGVGVIWVPYPAYLIHSFYTRTLRLIRGSFNG